MTQFRINGVYHNGYGDGPYRLYATAGDPAGFARLEHVTRGRRLETLWDLSTGLWTRDKGHSGMRLLPGELHNVNGEWLPIEDPELIALQTRQQHEPASVEEQDSRCVCRDHTAAPGVVHRVDGPCYVGESPRPPLAYFSEAKRFDPWGPEFIVHHREVLSVNARPFRDLSLDGCESYRAPKVL